MPGIAGIPRNSLGGTVKLGGKTHALARKRTVLALRPGAEVTLFDGTVGIRSQAGGRLHFPCLPFNPYSRTHRSGLRQAFLRLEVRLATDRPARIGINVRPPAGRP